MLRAVRASRRRNNWRRRGTRTLRLRGISSSPLPCDSNCHVFPVDGAKVIPERLESNLGDRAGGKGDLRKLLIADMWIQIGSLTSDGCEDALRCASYLGREFALVARKCDCVIVPQKPDCEHREHLALRRDS